MIKNVGIDIIQNKRIKPSAELSQKLLSAIELKEYETLFDKERQRQFLAGRWAAKEALIKALEIKLILNEVTIKLKDDNKLHVEGITLEENDIVHVSLSHERDYSVGIAIWSTY
ncbi:holo-[acyl-carrier-protein] synthase [Spiroplasma sp. NBRC 100390]|uniref:holo-ACP synthase n=1 Tax=unclassified Spiroplasma TaxID=2637901 RepID=UPI00089295A1|nr:MULTISPECIES: 4'-phosphopantetheinyl transferase superfamily protein [unclassified Spiroplasma]AOX44038.1 holo-[acyl-carrier-protein] synthase [Spiroplasma sp. TU-14]APE13508.1 holo-[acyl-carrier-protein] synthase [Spiroplasma sp. NBRC 100390]